MTDQTSRTPSILDEQQILNRMARCLNTDDAIGAAICEHAITGLSWHTNSSLEKWFPITAENVARLELEAADRQRQVKGVIQALTDAGFKYPVHLDHMEQDGTPVRDKLTLGFTVMLAFDDLRERLAKAEADARKWKARAEYEYGRRIYPDSLWLAVGALDAHMKTWQWDWQSEMNAALAHPKGDGNG